MRDERFLVTGALGCIGAWVVRNLVHEGTPVAAVGLARNDHRLRLILGPEEMQHIHFVNADVSEIGGVERALKEFGATNVIHLAALQLPLCRADPSRGALVNVVGTVNVFEAVKQTGLRRLVYASSTAVYGVSGEYPDGALPHDAPLKPRSHYGVHKQANEGMARVYWADDGIASIGLRPYVVYGAGRDRGMTSSPTKAMLAAVAGQAYRITYGGRYGFQYADDVARCFIRASRVEFEGAEVFNIGGESTSTPEVISSIEATMPSAAGKISYVEEPLPFPAEIDNAALAAAIGEIPSTGLHQGIAETMRIFRSAIADGRMLQADIEKMLEYP
jgi:UDP-glucuronate 4-epimerase